METNYGSHAANIANYQAYLYENAPLKVYSKVLERLEETDHYLARLVRGLAERKTTIESKVEEAYLADFDTLDQDVRLYVFENLAEVLGSKAPEERYRTVLTRYFNSEVPEVTA
jgi:predicted nuclease of restriction endonuclease-like RecB superfamily